MNVAEILARHTFEERVPVHLFRRLCRTDALAILDAESGARTTYAELGARATAISRALLQRGVKPGDRVAWSVPTGVDAIAVWMGIAQIGAIDVGIGDALKGALLDHVLKDSAPTALVIDPTMVAGLVTLGVERRRELPRSIFTRPVATPLLDGDLVVDLASPIDPRLAEELPEPQLDCSHAATIVYTSGTTGPSKGVLICHHQQFFTGATYSEYFRIDPVARLYHYSPFNHVSGRQLVVAAMLTGSLLVMRERFSVDRFWIDINAHRITHTIALGSAVPLLLRRAELGAKNEGSLRYVWASPALPVLYAEFSQRFGVKVISPYGSTEVGTVVDPGVIPDSPGPPGNSGRRPQYFDLEVVNERDEVCPPGVVGEIVVRPKVPWTTFLGYLGRDGATVQATRNFWYHSGDLARIDAEGYLFFVDRKQDFMRVKGENVSSRELEQILSAHPAVTDCAVVPVASDMADNEILAVIVLGRAQESFSQVDFFAWCADQVPHYMVPRYIRVVHDMPRGQSGKIEKHKLRTAGVSEGTWDSRAAGLRATRKGVQRSVRDDSAATGSS